MCNVLELNMHIITMRGNTQYAVYLDSMKINARLDLRNMFGLILLLLVLK
jgi:hypothetical protein